MNATKEKLGEDALPDLFSDAKKVVAAKGKKVVVIDMAKDENATDLLVANALGPTGNLRAPTIKIGKTWLIGFNEDEYGKVIN